MACHWNLAPAAATRFPSPIIPAVIVLPHREQLRRSPLIAKHLQQMIIMGVVALSVLVYFILVFR